MKRQFRGVISLLIAASIGFGLLCSTSSVYATGTFDNKAFGRNTTSMSTLGKSESNRSTTLTYPKNHSAYNINIKVEKAWYDFLTSTKYTIRMYDSTGKMVWSDTNQGERTYSIGSNVTKIVIITNDTTLIGLDVVWKIK